MLQQEIDTPSLSRVCFGQWNLLCILHSQATFSQSQDIFPASSTRPYLPPLLLPKFCSSQLPPEPPTAEVTFHLVCQPIPHVVAGLGPWNNSKQATLTIYWEAPAGCMFSCLRARMHSGLLSSALSCRVFTLVWAPEPTFLSTDVSLPTPPYFLAPRFSRSSVHCELTGTGAHLLAECRKNSGWNSDPSFSYHLVRMSHQAHACSTLGSGLFGVGPG